MTLLTNETDLTNLLEVFLRERRLRGLSPYTLKSNKYSLARFIKWCYDRDLKKAEEISRPILDIWRRWLYAYKTKENKSLSVGVQRGFLKDVRLFFKWMSKKRLLVYNPAADLELPRLPKTLPKDILSEREVELIFRQTDINDPLGLRDRAILETFYSTGISRRELSNLNVKDIDFDAGIVRINQGKGGKDRLVPIGSRALAWLEKYLDEARFNLERLEEPDALFLGRWGARLGTEFLSQRLKTYFKKAGLKKEGCCHIFRHSMATLMLSHGADTRVIQEILGHSKITTTQIYTRLSVERLKEVHNLTHPAKYRKSLDKQEDIELREEEE